MTAASRVVIVDDEALAVERLELALRCIPEAEVVGAFLDGREAVRAMSALRPDILILDVHMPNLDGFGVLRSLAAAETDLPEVIFVTASEEHAVRAFEVRAADYLVKPAPFARLKAAVQVARRRLESTSAEERFAQLQAMLEAARQEASGQAKRYQRELRVRQRDGLSRLPVAQVIVFRAEGDYVTAVTEDGTQHLMRDSITSLVERLDPADFLRVHRSSIVAVGRAKRLSRRTRRSVAVMMDTGDRVDVGPSYTDEVIARLGASRWR